jgi:hypothetical protein
LGPALALARSLPGGDPWPAVHVVVDPRAGGSVAGGLARRAAELAVAATVWRVEEGVPVRAEPAPVPGASPLAAEVAALAADIVAAGAEPVVEHGRLIAEVAGLEVARVAVDGDGPRLEIGVGRHDRETHAVVSAGLDPVATLRRVASTVREAREHGDGSHPLARLAAARGLRAALVRRPDAAGAALAGARLAPLGTVDEAPDLRTAWPAPAIGVDGHGRPVVAVCSVGIDLDLVPAAADARLAAEATTGVAHDLVLVLAARDQVGPTMALAAALVRPALVATWTGAAS